MSKFSTVDHEGIVKKNSNEFVVVQITSKAVCLGCHAEGVCAMSGKKDKTINIVGNYNLKKGDSVIVQMDKSLGFSAVILGYLIPFIIVITTLVVFLALKFKDNGQIDAITAATISSRAFCDAVQRAIVH